MTARSDLESAELAGRWRIPWIDSLNDGARRTALKLSRQFVDCAGRSFDHD